MQVHRNEHHITCDIAKTCTLDCFACRRQSYKFRNIPPAGWRPQNMPLSDLEKLCEVYKTVGFCGQVSDPIFHPQFHELLEIMERTGRECHIHTAATSPKLKMDFYEKAFEIHPRGKWFFGLDGLPDESPMYRTNQDGDFLFEVMTKAPNAIWQWIVFRFNQDSIDQGKELADKYGIQLQLNYSNRWWGHPADMDYEPTEMYWMAPDKKYTVPKANMNHHKNWGKDDFELWPKCIHLDQSIAYVNQGFLLPCCWVDGHEYEDDVSVFTQEKFRLENNDHVYDIIQSDEWMQFYDDLIRKPKEAPIECWKHCTNMHDHEKYGKDARRKRVNL